MGKNNAPLAGTLHCGLSLLDRFSTNKTIYPYISQDSGSVK